MFPPSRKMFGTKGALENSRVVIGVELSKTMPDNKQKNFC